MPLQPLWLGLDPLLGSSPTHPETFMSSQGRSPSGRSEVLVEEVLKAHALKVREGRRASGLWGPVLSDSPPPLSADEDAHSQTLTWGLTLTHPSYPPHSSRAQTLTHFLAIS